MGEGPVTGWRAAAERALYGPDGFFVRQAPASHFRTSVHVSPLFATAVTRLLLAVDEALGRPAELAFVDMGAGRAELARGVLDAVPGKVAGRLRVYAVERAARPARLDPRIEWRAAPPAGVVGLLFANEWLDNVPVDVVEVDEAGVARYVLVDPAGRERLGAPVAGSDAAWLRRWWPLGPPAGDGPGAAEAAAVPGRRAELGRPRDEAWAGAVGCLTRGLAVAVDFAHTRDRRPPLGTLTGYRDGHQVPPVPDGGCDLTCHVALDACAAAGAAAAATRPAEPRLLTQRQALHALGVDGRRPAATEAAADPLGYVRRLARAGEAAELTDPAGLGGFGWLVQPVGVASPLTPP